MTNDADKFDSNGATGAIPSFGPLDGYENSDCLWVIEPRPFIEEDEQNATIADQITLIFEQFTLLEGSKIEVYSRSNGNRGTLLATHKGTGSETIPDIGRYDVEQLEVLFKPSKSGPSGFGFRVSYQGGKCFSTTAIRSTNGTFTNGNGGALYSVRQNCLFLITSNNSFVTVSIWFPSFDLESNYDFLYVYDGDNTSAPLLLIQTGTNQTRNTTSTGSSLLINFVTDKTITQTGFVCSYKFNNQGCLKYKELSSYPAVPFAGVTQTRKAQCSWLIPGNTRANFIALYFVELSLMDSDEILVYSYKGQPSDSDTDAYELELKGLLPTTNFTPPANPLRVINSSRELVLSIKGPVRVLPSPVITQDLFLGVEFMKMGKESSFVSVYHAGECIYTVTLTGLTGSFQDGSGDSVYDPLLRCRWVIAPDSDRIKQIRLVFNYFDVEEDFDTMSIYAGPTLLDPLIATYDKNETIDSITSSSSVLLVVFSTDFSIQFQGFNISWETIEYDPFEINYVDWGDVIAIVLLSITAVLILLSLVLLFIVYKYRTRPVISFSSPLFCYIIIIAGIVGYVSVLLWFGEENQLLCILRIWWLGLIFTLIMSCLLAKTFRINRIFNSKSFKIRIISNIFLLRIVAFFLIIEIVILVLWTAIETPTSDVETDDISNGHRYCDYEIAFFAVYLGYKGLLILCAVYLAISTRNVESEFNEAGLIGLVVYNILLSTLIIVPLIYFIPEDNTDAQTIIRVVATQVVITLTLGILFIPKLFVLFIKQKKNTNNFSMRPVSIPETSAYSVGY